MRNVSLRYFTQSEEIEALRDVNLSIDEGEFVAIVGPSGCGKSTLLSLIAGVMMPTVGDVRLFGQELTEPSPRVGYMLQHDHLLEWRNVLQNVLVGATIRKLDRFEANRRALDLLQRYGLDAFANLNPKQLSGGMRQRVALIRTLVVQPDILLLDEPFSALDYQTRLALSDEMARILREQGKTVVLVTHDISEAVSMADRIIVMSKRPSTIKAQYMIDFAGPRPTPLDIHQSHEYHTYFEAIWGDLADEVRI